MENQNNYQKFFTNLKSGSIKLFLARYVHIKKVIYLKSKLLLIYNHWYRKKLALKKGKKMHMRLITS